MKEIWVVTEDNHGDVSYWSTKEKAIEEMERIIFSDESFDEELLQEFDDFINYDDWVFARKVTLDKPWL